MAASLVLTGFQMAGSIAGHHMGFGFLSLFDPSQRNQSAVIDEFYSIIGMLIFLAINGHHLLLQALDRTFRAVPLGGAIHPETVSMPMGQLISEIFAAAFQLALPIMAALLLADVALGLISKAVPQINVLFLGLPLKVLLGLLALSLALPALVSSMEVQIQSGVRSMVNLSGML
jgi:flagellar biosynthetic protein FliR